MLIATGCVAPAQGRAPGAESTSFETGDDTTDATTDALPDLPDAETGDGDGDGDGDPGDGDGDGDGDPGDGDPYGPPLYPDDRVHSPINAFVRDNLASIRSLAPAAPADVFMKVGASSTVSPSTLYCFADGVVDLDIHEDALGSTLDFFLLGEAGNTTPFDRDTLAAMSGKGAGWAIEGMPAPIEQERAAIHPKGPSLALVHYGTNDMQLGITYASAMPGYFANMSDLLDLLIDAGVVPIVFGISRRLDSEPADLWVQTYNAVSRGLAQARSIPFIDLRLATEPLPNHGISGDGLHLEGFSDGVCLFSPEGLTHGYNMRNLIALQGLDRTHRSLLAADPDPDPDPDPDIDEPALFLQGLGDIDSPLEIPGLPFADTNSTIGAPSLMLDVYAGCGALADESGPENIYQLELAQTTPIRAMVLDRAGVDIDIHVLDDTASEAGCIARADRLLELTLDPGTYYFSLDTYVNGQAIEQSGEYTFVVLACEVGDVDCL
ncbi:Multiple EGF-like-domain protein 3 precursor [Enhygromyxa salina]|uniref:Multiple EGF-like-domain protein 3 n=1 Tax=Enhygromyxa salina TaxID=215803 RepID=A0A0C2D0B1_9BACT|nr:Multiple EGF-like-domain protein 3 precursor [Enhygromyxa salina]